MGALAHQRPDIAAHEDHRQVGTQQAQALRDLRAGEPRHDFVGDHRVEARRRRFDLGEGVPAVSSVTRSVPLPSIAWMALVHRFISTWWSCVASPTTFTAAVGTLPSSRIPGGSEPRTRSSVSPTTRPRSTGTRSPRWLRLYARI